MSASEWAFPAVDGDSGALPLYSVKRCADYVPGYAAEPGFRTI